MKKGRHSEAEIFKILKAGENGLSVAEVTRQYGISQVTFYAWRSKYGGVSTQKLTYYRAHEDASKLIRNKRDARHGRSEKRSQERRVTRGGSQTGM